MRVSGSTALEVRDVHCCEEALGQTARLGGDRRCRDRQRRSAGRAGRGAGVWRRWRPVWGVLRAVALLLLSDAGSQLWAVRLGLALGAGALEPLGPLGPGPLP